MRWRPQREATVCTRFGLWSGSPREQAAQLFPCLADTWRSHGAICETMQSVCAALEGTAKACQFVAAVLVWLRIVGDARTEALIDF
jgi:hypothetical protein